MTTPEERLARLEGAYEHLATKSDVANLRAELKTDISNLQKWIVGLMLSSVALSVTLAIFIQRLLD